MMQANVFQNQSAAQARAPKETANTGSPTSIVVGFFRYNGRGTTINPPTIGFSLPNAPDFITNSGTLLVQQMPNNLSSGVQSDPQQFLTRSEFMTYLVATEAGKVPPKSPPPGPSRLVDWLSFFKQTDIWMPSQGHPKQVAPFDVTINDAILALAKYQSRCVESKHREDPFEPRRAGPYFRVITEPVSQLNGSHGSFTGTDDVKMTFAEREEMAKLLLPAAVEYLSETFEYRSVTLEKFLATEFKVNPEGCSWPMDLVFHASKERDANGWHSPAAGIVFASHTTAIWEMQARLTKARVKKMEPKGKWTANKLRVIQCTAMGGQPCRHTDAAICPGTFKILIDISLHCVNMNDPNQYEWPDHCTTLNGNNGSATNTDDVELHACTEKCNASHQHLKKRKHKAPEGTPGGTAAQAEAATQSKAKKGAELRITIAKMKKLTTCMHNGQNVHTCNGVCPVRGDAPHWHSGTEMKSDEPEDMLQDAVDAHDTTATTSILKQFMDAHNGVSCFGVVPHKYDWADYCDAYDYAESKGCIDPDAFACDVADRVHPKTIDEVARVWALHPDQQQQARMDREYEEALDEKHVDCVADDPPDGDDEGDENEADSGSDSDGDFDGPGFNAIDAEQADGYEMDNYDPARDQPQPQPAARNNLRPVLRIIRLMGQIIPFGAITAARAILTCLRNACAEHGAASALRGAESCTQTWTHGEQDRLAISTPVTILKPGHYPGAPIPRFAHYDRENGLEPTVVVGEPVPAPADNAAAALLAQNSITIDPIPIISDIVNKARTLWTRRDPASATDRSAVLNSLINIARKEHAQTALPHIDSLILDISESAARRATALKLAAAHTRATRVVGPVRKFIEAVRGNYVLPCSNYSSVDDLAELDTLKPYSRIVLNRSTHWAVRLAKLTVISAMLRKVITRVRQIKVPEFLFGASKHSWLTNVPYFKMLLGWLARTKPRLATGIYVCAIAPALEESFKFIAWGLLLRIGVNPLLARFIPGIALGMWEAHQFGHKPWSIPFFAMHIGKAVFHSSVMSERLHKAIIVHTWWNTGTYAFMTSMIGLRATGNFTMKMLDVEPIRVDPSPIGELQRHGHRPLGDGTNCVTDICLADYDVKTATTQDGFKVREGEFVCTPAHGCTGYWGIRGYSGTVFRSCTCNERISMAGRVGKKLPMHTDAQAEAAVLVACNELRAQFVQILSTLKLKKTYTPMPFDQWTASFEPARRDLLRAIVEEGRDLPDLRASSFIKKEITVKEVATPVFKDPRFIQGCPPELSCRVGPYLRVFAHNVRDCLAPSKNACTTAAGRQVYYTCGRNAQEIGDAFTAAIADVKQRAVPDDPIVYIEDDQSRFDLHLTEGPFRVLAAVYKRFLPKKVARLLVRTEKSRGTSNLGTRYVVPYTMQSGWPDTSVGDTLLNAAMKYFIHGFGRNWSSIICGDDSVTVTTMSELVRMGGKNGIRDSYARYGMEVEVEVRRDPLDVDFCSARFFPTEHTYILMPKTGKILSRICWDDKVRSKRDRMVWLRSIAHTLDLYGKVDLLIASLAEMLHEYCGEGQTNDLTNSYKFYVGLTPAVAPSHSDLAKYYEHHYGMSLATVADLGRAILASTIGDFLDDERFVMIVQHDI